jgi:hypothetical protein
MAIASHGESHILIRKSRRRGINNLLACGQHFVGGVAGGTPRSYLSRLVGHFPVFTGSVSEACRNVLTAGS